MSVTGKRVEVGVYQKAKKGNYYCGDSYFYTETENEFVCALADGLGSGEFARESSQVVVDIIKDNIHASIEQIIKRCNENLTGKRGVVIGILKIDFTSKRYSFSSIGNIGVITISQDGKKKRNIPNGGYLAGYHRPFKIENGKVDSVMNFIMFSDGVSDAELAQKYFLNKNVNETIATYEFKNGQAKDDDTTLIAMRYTG
ncbi:indirect negative regulator of sigma-B activity [Virgibacillus phasianinus]|uniref:Indirect negative regulator of sigma-B activity n=1 Tax=Virgibacillus phasianinus TaxID=2017483 RepID=A0A220TZR5_9BACI|nr:protein phosphatase 2C domain-containing protein [Virgibacillus phasianinus]ASK61245.1 indirect negative regulator of sigma-B activity [Virgibacillus phasianinus]